MYSWYLHGLQNSSEFPFAGWEYSTCTLAHVEAEEFKNLQDFLKFPFKNPHKPNQTKIKSVLPMAERRRLIVQWLT